MEDVLPIDVGGDCSSRKRSKSPQNDKDEKLSPVASQSCRDNESNLGYGSDLDSYVQDVPAEEICPPPSRLPSHLRGREDFNTVAESTRRTSSHGQALDKATSAYFQQRRALSAERLRRRRAARQKRKLKWLERLPESSTESSSSCNTAEEKAVDRRNKKMSKKIKKAVAQDVIWAVFTLIMLCCGKSKSLSVSPSLIFNSRVKLAEMTGTGRRQWVYDQVACGNCGPEYYLQQDVTVCRSCFCHFWGLKVLFIVLLIYFSTCHFRLESEVVYRSYEILYLFFSGEFPEKV